MNTYFSPTRWLELRNRDARGADDIVRARGARGRVRIVHGVMKCDYFIVTVCPFKYFLIQFSLHFTLNSLSPELPSLPGDHILKLQVLLKHPGVLTGRCLSLLLALPLLPVEIELLEQEFFIDLIVGIYGILDFLGQVLGLITLVTEVLDIFADFDGELALYTI
jgi:hypothetical protein